MDTMDAPPGASPEDRFRALYRATYPDLLRFVQRRAHPTHAEDVVADVFTVAWRRHDEIPSAHDEARAWLYGVARRSLLNASRGEHRRDALAIRLADVGRPEPGTDPELVALRLDLARVWRRLPATDQEALALAVLDGLSAPEAARVLQISPTAFRLRLSRARRALRRALAGDAADPSALPRTTAQEGPRR